MPGLNCNGFSRGREKKMEKLDKREIRIKFEASDKGMKHVMDEILNKVLIPEDIIFTMRGKIEGK